MPHRPPTTDETQIVNEQAAPYPPRPPSSVYERLVGSRHEDRKLRRLTLLVGLAIGLISLSGSVWRGGTKVARLATTLTIFDSTVRSLKDGMHDLGSRVDSLSTQERRFEINDSVRENRDSLRFAALEKFGNAVNRATAVIVKHDQ